MSRSQASFPAASLARNRASYSGISLGTLGIGAAALLIFVSGSFIVTQILGFKRPLEGVLIAPLTIAAAYYWVTCPGRSVDPLIGFVLVKTIVEIALRHEAIWVLDNLASLCALTVIYSTSPRNVEIGAKIIVIVAGAFGMMALLQWLLLFFFQDLASYRLVLSDADIPVNGLQNPIVLLGLFTDEEYTFLGRSIGRVHSFAKEPSLNLLYFLIPASIGLFLESRVFWVFSAVMLMFCLLSLSGSVFMSLGLSAVWWGLMNFVSLRLAFTYGLPLLMVGYLYSIKASGLEPLVNAVTYTSQYGDFLNKGESLTNRALNTGVNLDTALGAPFGSSVHPDLPGPWLINSTLEAGWLGCLMLIIFLAKFATQLEINNANTNIFDQRRLGTLLLLGAMSTIIVFNDYQMSNYAGVTLMGFAYRLLTVKNEQRSLDHAISS